MFKIEKCLYDLFLWENIENKYSMKYLNKYGLIEEDFINDLIKNKIISVRYNDIDYHSYQEILNDKNVKSNDIVLLRTFCKYIYDKDILDNSEFGKMSEKIIWE